MASRLAQCMQPFGVMITRRLDAPKFGIAAMIAMAAACASGPERRPAPATTSTAESGPTQPAMTAPATGAKPEPEDHVLDMADHTSPTEAVHAHYVCPMHPEVNSDDQGKCPKCGMKLVLPKNVKMK